MRLRFSELDSDGDGSMGRIEIRRVFTLFHVQRNVNSTGAFGTFPWIDRESGTYGVLVTLGSISEILPFALNLRRLAIELER